MRAVCITAALSFGLLATQGQAATFTATAKGTAVKVYSTATVPERCTARVQFSYMGSDGKRQIGQQVCQDFLVQPGKNLEVCKVDNPILIDLRIEGDVTAQCTDDPNAQTAPR